MPGLVPAIHDKGKLIGPNNLRTAAPAKTLRCVLVTNN